PEEVTQQLLDGLQPELEPWQTPADAWKQGPAATEPQPRAPVAQVADPPSASQRLQAALDARVDELLRKIARQGMDALSSAERRYLEEASRRYREKRRT